MSRSTSSAVSFLTRKSLEHPLAFTVHKGSKSPGFIYVPGFMSGMGSPKSIELEKLLTARGHSFIRYDPSHLFQSKHPELSDSSQLLPEFSLAQWKQDALDIIDHVATGPQVLIGSSMGGWLSVLAAEERPNRVTGLVLMAAAIDFIRPLFNHHMSANPTDQDRFDAGESWFIQAPGSTLEYPVTKRMLTEGCEMELLRREGVIEIGQIPVRLFHGMSDPLADMNLALALADKLSSNDVEYTLRKSSDHDISSAEEIDLIYNSCILPLCNKLSSD